MNKRTRILILVFILILWGLFLFFFRIRDFDFISRFDTKFFVRNLSWQTDFRSSVPYKKWDSLEYIMVLSGDSLRNIAIDISALKNILDIERIELNDTEIQEKDIGKLTLRDSSLLKITGKAKSSSTVDTVIQPKVTTTPIKDTKSEEVKKKEETLAVITEPTDIALDRTNRYSSNINNLITFHGKNLENIEFVNIGEKRIRPVYSSGTLFVQIDQNTFTAGEYFIFFVLKNGKILTSNDHISFDYTDSIINIANISPKQIQNNEDRFIVIQGNGFDKIMSIQLSNNLILKNAEFSIINKQVAWVKIPKNLPVWEYYFNIMDTNSIYELTNMRFTITN